MTMLKPNKITVIGAALIAIGFSLDSQGVSQQLHRAVDQIVNKAPQKALNPAEVKRLSAELRVAAMQGDLAQVKTLLGQGADKNRGDQDGLTPLILAAVHGHRDVVEALLGAKADPNKGDILGWTPLIEAAYYGHAGIVQALLEGGAEAGRKNSYGLGAQNFARDSKIVQLLKSAGA